jgi:hypothetical protein
MTNYLIFFIDSASVRLMKKIENISIKIGQKLRNLEKEKL